MQILIQGAVPGPHIGSAFGGITLDTRRVGTPLDAI